MKPSVKNLIYLAIIAVLLTACKHSTDAGKNLGQSAIKVVTTKVSFAESSYSLSYSGTIEASQTIPLSFQTSGTVENVYVEAGDAVKKGQLLASVDNSDMSNIYHVTLAKFQQAEDAYNRLKKVHDEGSLPEIKWVEMVTNYEQAKSSLELSKNNLDKCNLRAPVDGIIGHRNIEPGQSSISLSITPFDIVDIKTVYVKVSVPENEIGKIKKGLKASFSASALNDKVFEGEVSNISPVADVISRTYAIKISVKNSGLELKPGMICDVTINLNSESTPIVVPYKAVSKDREGNTFVYIVSSDNNRVKKQIIKTGNYNDSGIEIISGLTTGQVIVSEGTEKLSDNSLISL